jgi:hypothetical protein
MAGGTIASGANPSYTGTITSASTAEQTTFADRYNYVTVTNDGATVMSVTTNGVTATATGAGVYTIPPNTSLTLANQLPYWDQSSNALIAGVPEIPTGGGTFSEALTSTTKTSAAQPGRVYPMMGSMQGNIPAGSYPNPGVKVSVFSATATAPYTIAGSG